MIGASLALGFAWDGFGRAAASLQAAASHSRVPSVVRPSLVPMRAGPLFVALNSARPRSGTDEIRVPLSASIDASARISDHVPIRPDRPQSLRFRVIRPISAVRARPCPSLKALLMRRLVYAA